MSGANERMHKLQSALAERGVADVKFCFTLGLAAKPSSEVVGNVSDFMDAYMKGEYSVREKIGDVPTK